MRNKPKGGNLSKSDKEFILVNYDVMTPAQMSLRLNRSVEQIKKFIIRNVGKTYGGETQPTEDRNELQEHVEIKEQLRSRPEYDELKHELSTDEIKFFEYRYAQLLSQFKEDILPSEAIQLFKAIKFEIMMERAMKAQRQIELNRTRMDKMAENIFQMSKDENQSDEDKKKSAEEYVQLEEQINSCRQAQTYKVKEVRELNKEHEGLLEALRASRQQRISKIENSKKTFIELIKEIHDEDFREREGRLLGLAQLAEKKESERLGALHTYMDGVSDNPILNSETV